MKNKISGLLTTYNESQYLEECLQRLSFCDEIIVVDLGSSDESVEIAERYGCTLLHHELVPFAEKVRDLAIRNARNDWVLFTDPDMYFPLGIEKRIDNFLADCTEEIGLIHMPAKKYFRNKPIQYGSKSAIESRVALLDRKKVDFLPLVHYSGFRPKENIIPVGLMLGIDDYIEHHWVDRMSEAVEKALRYLPYEAERRHDIYQGYSFRATVKEFFKLFIREMRSGAYKDWLGIQIWLFNIWYVIDANIRWIIFELDQKIKNA